MVEYGRAIGSVVGATMVVGAVGGMARKGKKIALRQGRWATKRSKKRK